MIIFIVVLIVLVACLLYHLFPLVQVIGSSMYPTYHDSEIIWGTRAYRKSKLKIGDVITYRCPTDKKIVIKRINNILIDVKNKDRLFYCIGDNLAYSYDSRNYGCISSKAIVCKIIKPREKVDF